MDEFRSLASSLAQNTNILADELERTDHDISFDGTSAPIDLPLLSSQGSAARSEIISAAEKILRVAYGPLSYLYRFGDVAIEIGVLRTVVKLGLPAMIPLQGSVSYAELAAQTRVSMSVLQRLVRFAITSGVFTETDNGENVKHNAMSSIFLKDPPSADGMAWVLDMCFRSSTKIYEATRLDGTGQDPKKVATSIEYRDGEDELPSLWDVHAKNPDLERGFNNVMLSQSVSPSYSVQHVISGFDWTQVKSVVDVGGGVGHIAKEIVKNFPHIHCTVQDIEKTIQQAHPTERNVELMVHDFFQPQTVHADLFLYRFILHDWSDAEAKQILQASLSGLKDGARLAIMDIAVPEPGVESLFVEKSVRAVDITLYTMLAGKERTLTEMKDLMDSVSPHLEFEHRCQPSGSLLSFMTWVYRVPLPN